MKSSFMVIFIVFSSLSLGCLLASRPLILKRYRIVAIIRMFFNISCWALLVLIFMNTYHYPYSLNENYQKTSEYNLLNIIFFGISVICNLLSFISWFIGNTQPSKYSRLKDFYSFIIFNLFSDLISLVSIFYWYFGFYTTQIPIKNNDIIIKYDTLRPELDYSTTYIYFMALTCISLILNFWHLSFVKDNKGEYDEILTTVLISEQ